jgi:hypothetical protein
VAGADGPAAQDGEPGEGAHVEETERALLPARLHLQGQGGQGQSVLSLNSVHPFIVCYSVPNP